MEALVQLDHPVRKVLGEGAVDAAVRVVSPVCLSGRRKWCESSVIKGDTGTWNGGWMAYRITNMINRGHSFRAVRAAHGCVAVVGGCVEL